MRFMFIQKNSSLENLFLLLSVPESKPKKVTFPDEDIVIFKKSLVDYNYIFLR